MDIFHLLLMPNSLPIFLFVGLETIQKNSALSFPCNTFQIWNTLHLLCLIYSKWCLFLCLFGFFIVPLNNFSLIWRHHHCRWRTANFDLCSASWTLSSEDSLACHTDFDTGHPFIMVIFEDPWHWHLHVLPSV